MRVLHAADFGGVAPGGFVPLIAALARRLTARGDELALAVPRTVGATWHQQVRDAGAELHLVAGPREAARFARAWRPDVAHVHFFGWEVPLTLALWRSRARIFWHAHSTSLRGGRVQRSPKTVAKYRLAGARVERFVTVTRAVGDELHALGAPRARIVAIRNEVDSARFRPPSSAERERARAALGLRGDERAILFFGRDPLLKGADVLAAALAPATRGPTAVANAVVVTVATPAQTQRELARHARVIGVDFADDVVPLLWASDALAVPSRGEGFSLVLLEAALAGLPVAATDLPALREAASGHDAVFFAPLGDASAFARALNDALAVPRRYDDPGTAANARRNALDDWAERVDALYAVS
jgi:glycosyltransferase involved in cell wall biosynthesis